MFGIGGRGGHRGRGNYRRGYQRHDSAKSEFEDLKYKAIIFCTHCTGDIEDNDWLSGFKNLVLVFRHHYWDPTELEHTPNSTASNRLTRQLIRNVLEGLPQRIENMPTLIAPHFYYFITVLPNKWFSLNIDYVMNLVNYCLPEDVQHQDPEFSAAAVYLLNWIKKSEDNIKNNFDVNVVPRLKQYTQQSDDAFRLEPIFPTEEEINIGTLQNIDRQYKPNIRSSFEAHLQSHFRLLREDFLSPIVQYLYDIHHDTTYDYNNKKPPVRKYELRHKGRALTPRGGIIELFAVEMDKKKRERMNWSKVLLDGNMMILSSSRNFPYDKLVFGCITLDIDTNNKNDINVGFVVCEDYHRAFDAMRKDGTKKFYALETHALFVPYHRSLLALREIHASSVDEDIINAIIEGKTVIPKFFLDAQVDLGVFVCKKGVEKSLKMPSVSDKNQVETFVDVAFRDKLEVSTPEKEKSVTSSCNNHIHILDATQQDAIKQMLKANVAIVQGPPGTGKTFVGRKYLQMLLKTEIMDSNSLFPIMLVGYTNHAVDAVLKEVKELFPDDKIVRLGFPKEESLKKYSLVNQSKRLGSLKPPEKVSSLLNRKKEMTELSEKVQKAKSLIATLAKRRSHEEREYPTPEDFFRRPTPEDENYRTIEHLIMKETVWRSCIEEYFDSWYYAVDEVLYRRKPLEQLHETLLDLPGSFYALCSYGLRRVFDAEYNNEMDNINDVIIGTNNDNSDEAGVEYDKDDALVCDSSRSSSSAVQAEAEAVVDDPSLFSSREVRKAVMTILDDILPSNFNPLCNEFIENKKILREYFVQRDTIVLQQMQLIVATTTGAARYLEALRRSNVRIVFVEEAAEILEGHILSLLTKSIQQVVLVGDPMQLRPKLVTLSNSNNPLAYSLQERLILRGAEYASICTQRRMHPDIAALVKPYYADPPQSYKPITIVDHDSTTDREAVPWITDHSRIIFINHNNKEEKNEYRESWKNVWEAHAAMRIADFIVTMLSRFGLSSTRPQERVTILTLYTGQVLLLKEIQDKGNRFGNNVRIATVDDFQGEENDVIILSLTRTEWTSEFFKERNRVCVALSRARCAMVVLGNQELLTRSCGDDSMWRTLFEKATIVDVTADNSFFPSNCPVHNAPQQMRLPLDYRIKINDTNWTGHCNTVCGARFEPCPYGHTCEKDCHGNVPHSYCKTRVTVQCSDCNRERKVFCYLQQKPPDRHHLDYRNYCCTAPCIKFANCGHPCDKRCCDVCECAGEELCAIDILQWCKHRSPTVTVNCAVGQAMLNTLEDRNKNNKNNNQTITSIQELYDKAKKTVIKRKSKLKAIIQKSEEEGRIVINECFEPCTNPLPCGHCCKRICHKDLLCYCSVSCGTKRSCGHNCSIPCSHDGQPVSTVATVGLPRQQPHIQHLYCVEPCPYKDKYLSCGHSCTRKCTHDSQSSEGVCLCTSPCQHRCHHNNPDHTNTEHHCGECVYVCKQNCPRKPCVHKIKSNSSAPCTARCSEPCNNALAEPCRERCEEELDCGHRCYGACGERCPKLCLKCLTIDADDIMVTEMDIEKKQKQEKLVSEWLIDTKLEILANNKKQIEELEARGVCEEGSELENYCVSVSFKDDTILFPLLFEYPCGHLCFLHSVDKIMNEEVDIPITVSLCCPKCRCEVQYCDTSRFNTQLKEARHKTITHHNIHQRDYASQYNEAIAKFDDMLENIKKVSKTHTSLVDLLASIPMREGLQLPGKEAMYMTLSDINVLIKFASKVLKVIEEFENFDWEGYPQKLEELETSLLAVFCSDSPDY